MKTITTKTSIMNEIITKTRTTKTTNLSQIFQFKIADVYQNLHSFSLSLFFWGRGAFEKGKLLFSTLGWGGAEGKKKLVQQFMEYFLLCCLSLFSGIIRLLTLKDFSSETCRRKSFKCKNVSAPPQSLLPLLYSKEKLTHTQLSLDSMII